ncbi:MAG: hypothetical protein LBQ35_06165 [Spirochaetaceae bacterium]|jgi:hypothetical protein|nr:hypothetical protein [Spirochaetaceae bacterium]
MTRILPALALALLLLSCASVDMEKRVRQSAAGTVPREPPAILTVPIEMPPPLVIEIERPVYPPDAESPAPQPPERGRGAVSRSNSDGILQPSEYSRAAMIYDYHSDWVYEV